MHEEEFEHHAEPLTVAQLRAQLAEYPDDMPVNVSTLEEPGGDMAEPVEQVVTGVDRFVERDPAEPEPPKYVTPYVTILCDWPSGTYHRKVIE